MSSRRVSQETSKYFAAAAAAPRRSTRASLARFAHREDSATTSATVKDETEDNTKTEDLIFGSDIEDAVTTSRSRTRRSPITAARAKTTTIVTTRKRKRTETLIKPDESLKSEPSSPEPAAPPPAKPRRERKPARPKTDPATGSTTIEAPSDWEEMYALVKEMRISGPAANAAVDTMGCERLASADASPRDRRFHTLIALMLSSQTKDTVNAVAMARLKAELPPCRPGAPPGLNLENILAVEPALLNELIWQVGFHNNKTKYIKQAAEILRDQWDGDIPDTIAGLTALPGVGPKMAHLCMSAPNGWNRVEGIGVDVHVHRITNLWGWNKTNNPEATRAALQSWLPKDRWREINWLLVGLGQSVCLPVGRRCGDCELGIKGLCRAADRKKVFEGRKMRAAEGEVAVVEKHEDEEKGVKMVVKADDESGSHDVKTEAKVEVKAAVKEEDVKVEFKEEIKTVVKEEVLEECLSIKDEIPQAPRARPRRRTGR